MSLIEIRDLHKNYKNGVVEVHALRGVTLSIDKGEFVAIAGPSGSGKTSLLNIIGGLDLPSSGYISVDNRDLSKMAKNELARFRLFHVGFIFQAYNLIPVLTAYENAEYVLLLQGWEKERRRKRIEELFQALEIIDYIDTFPDRMSGGQQQRVAIARALAARPKLILADEPTANLDSKSGERLLELMRRMNEKENITFIFSTHDRMVMEFAKRLVLLKDGMIVEDRQQ